MYEENYSDYLDEDEEDGKYLSGVCHIEEYAEYIDWQKGNDGALDDLGNHTLKVVYGIFQGLSVCCSKS